MKKYKYLILILLSVFIFGCDSVEDKREQIENKKARMKTGELRREIFKECMELAAKMPRQADDDVSDIVGECNMSAYYMANHIGGTK